MLGFDPAEFHETNSAWIAWLHPDDRAPVAVAYRDCIAGRPLSHSRRLHRSDPSVLPRYSPSPAVVREVPFAEYSP